MNYPDVSSLRFAERMHMNHYGSSRLPYAGLSASGLTQTLIELEGPRAGRVFDVLDASGGYGSAPLGAANEAAHEWLTVAVEKHGYGTDEYASWERTRLLLELFGEHGCWSEFFPANEYHVAGRNSGSEGMELALRLVLESRFDRRRLGSTAGRESRSKVLAFEGAWHGWTTGLLPLLNRRHFSIGLPAFTDTAPFGLSVDHIPFGDADAAREYFAKHGEHLLAVVVEPIQGDAGIIEPPEGYLRELSRLAKEFSAVLVADEVLTFAKTGRFFAMADAEGQIPTDITVIGKGLGMGLLSTSMVIARREFTARPSGVVATSDLRPLTCSVIRHGLRYIADHKLIEKASTTGKILCTLVQKELVERFPDIYFEGRGQGLMYGVELTESVAEKLPILRGHLIESGVYVEFMAGAGPRSRGLRYVFPTLRLTPPLIAKAEEIEQIVDRLISGTASFMRSRA